MSLSNKNHSNKRIRCDGTRNNTMRLQLSDLPEGLLPKMASYLSNTSCVSFAISLFDAPTSQEPSAFSKAIINASNENWESTDFKDIQDIFDRNLTDDDIRWVLLAIDGVNKIKSLKLTNCVGITGSGLEPLAGSTVLKRIDLSLVGDYQNPTIDPEPPISVSLVVPILNSIIEKEDNSLVHVHLPKKWRMERSNVLTQFLQRFDRVLNERRYQCSKCEGICATDVENAMVCWREEEIPDIERYGTVAMSCCLCKKNFCSVCDFNCEGTRFCCMGCEKFYCDECNYVEFCQGDCTTFYQASTCTKCDAFKRW